MLSIYSESKIFFYSCLDSYELKIWFERVQRGISEEHPMISLNFQFSFKWRTFCSIYIYFFSRVITCLLIVSSTIPYIYIYIYITFQPVRRAPSSRLTRTEFMKQCNFISPVYTKVYIFVRILHGVGHIINSCDISHTSYRRLHTARL